MREFGVYLVTGHRDFRGHSTGTEFVALIDRNAERRAVGRRDIQLLRRVVPALEPKSFTFPKGWLDSPSSQSTRGAERRLTH